MMFGSFGKDASSRSSSWCRLRWTAAAAITLLVSLLAGSLPTASALAQFTTTDVPAVMVIGTGDTSAPADMATVQILFGFGNREFGFSERGSGSSSFESASASESPDPGDGSEGRRGDRRPEPQMITAEQADALTKAVAGAAGIEPDDVETYLSPLAARRGEDRARNVRLELVVSQPSPEVLAELFATASDVAAENDLVVEVVGARYDSATCATLEEAAEAAAIADAEVHAERLARLLGVTLGGVVGANSVDFGYDPVEDEGGCSGQRGSSYDSQHGGLGITLPVFDPAEPAEVTVASVLAISYEIVRDTAE